MYNTPATPQGKELAEAMADKIRFLDSASRPDALEIPLQDQIRTDSLAMACRLHIHLRDSVLKHWRIYAVETCDSDSSSRIW
jgi:hypothetical protein